KPGHTIAEVRKVLDEEMARVLAQPVSADELSRVKTKYEADFVRRLESGMTRGNLLQNANHYTHDPGQANQVLPRHLAVTPEAIQAAAKKWLLPDHKLVVTVVPSKQAPVSGQLVSKTEGAK